MPATIGDAAGLSVLIGALREWRYDRQALEKLAYQNWLRDLLAIRNKIRAIARASLTARSLPRGDHPKGERPGVLP